MEAHARRTDVSTSHEAAESVDAGTHLFKVYDWLRTQRRANKTFDREQLVGAMKDRMSPQSARSRLSELMQADLVHDTGHRRTTAQGRSQQVLWPGSGLVLLPWPDIMQKVLDARAVKQEHERPWKSVVLEGEVKHAGIYDSTEIGGRNPVSWLIESVPSIGSRCRITVEWL